MGDNVAVEGFIVGLALLFIALKLIGIIDWAWWLVLMPILGPLGLGLLFIIGWGLLMCGKIAINYLKK